jgi:polysaccharide deacetylase family protein (PEP-CTERM system associated)
VEDWFHIIDIPGAPQIPQWDSLPSCVERNFMRLLDLFSEKHATATCFFLGWVAERFPNLVKEAVQRGHEIASHGYAHQLTYQLSNAQFYEDVLRSRKLLEDAAGVAVHGYRAPSFSVSEWFFETLIEAGYLYDASVFPAAREHGGTHTNADAPNRLPHVIKLDSGSIFEFPMSVVDVLGKPLCFSGGGYLRLLPYSLISHWSRQVIGEGKPVVFYIHPREIDPHHPRLAMGIRRGFKTYVNLNTTESKLARILDEFSVTTFRDYLSRNTHSMEITRNDR